MRILGSLEFFRSAVRRNGDVPLLTVMLTRPSFFEQHADWTEGDDSHIRLDLTPLDKVFSRELADTLLQRVAEVPAALPAALPALVTNGAEGNPFYMEELVKMLIDDGVIVAEAEGWRVLPDKLLGTRVPPKAHGEGRLDEKLKLYDEIGYLPNERQGANLLPTDQPSLRARTNDPHQ